MKTIILFILLVSATFAQSPFLLLMDGGTTTTPPPSGSGSFRDAVLLTHSSGSRLYDYDTYMVTDSTDISVPLLMNTYNSTNGYTGSDSVWMVRRWFPDSYGTDWYNWLIAFDGTIDDGSNFWAKLDTFSVIIIKGGIQNTLITGYGSNADTLDENRTAHLGDETVVMYKWILKVLVDSMANHPETFFCIMTAPPAPERFQTTNGARLSQEFSGWMKDTLALGISDYGAFPDNIYIFDYFTYFADVDGNLKVEYEIPAPAEDFHQNATACDVVAPLFVDEVFDASITYESIYNPPPAPDEEMETTRFLASLGTGLASGTETAIDSFVVMLKDTFALDSLSQMFNAIYLHAIETEEASKLNLVKRSHDITESGTDLVWTANEGWNGVANEGASVGYLNLNYNPATDSANVVGRLSTGITAYIRICSITDLFGDAGVIVGANDGGGNQIQLSVRRNDDNVLYKLNDDTFNSALTNATNNIGVYTLSRVGNDRNLFKNSAVFLNETVAPTGLPNQTLYEFRNNISGTASGGTSSKQISILMIHRGLNLTEHQSLRNILEWWMDRWNKGVL